MPLDWQRPDGPTITAFAREVVDAARDRDVLPLLLFLQGGPGGKSPRPTGGGPAWLREAIRTHRVVLLDQRGTGRSSPVEAWQLADLSPEAAAAHLALHRADSIVRDAEHIRRTVYGGVRWETLGQSYGGFITLTYLSLAPEGLAACYVTGGLPGLDATADEVYRRTFPRARAKSERFYARYPEAAARIARVADLLAAEDVRLPDGDRLTVRRLQMLGMDFGTAAGFENVWFLFDEAFADAAETRLSATFLASVLALTQFDHNPLYAVLQECIYGQDQGATAWAAERALASHAAFAPERRPLLFPGEMMYSWMFREIRSLRPFAAAAEALAAKRDWPALYDPGRLAANEVRSRPRSITTTSTSTPASRSRPPRASATPRPGSPTNTSTTACAPRKRCSHACATRCAAAAARGPHRRKDRKASLVCSDLTRRPAGLFAAEQAFGLQATHDVTDFDIAVAVKTHLRPSVLVFRCFLEGLVASSFVIGCKQLKIVTLEPVTPEHPHHQGLAEHRLLPANAEMFCDFRKHLVIPLESVGATSIVVTLIPLFRREICETSRSQTLSQSCADPIGAYRLSPIRVQASARRYDRVIVILRTDIDQPAGQVDRRTDSFDTHLRPPR